MGTDTEKSMKTEREKRLEAALQPFAHEDLCIPLPGSMADDAIIYERNKATLRRSDFVRAREAIADEGSGGGDYSCAQCGTTDPQEHDANCMFGTGDSAPPQRRDALEILDDVIDVLSEYAQDKTTPYGPARNVSALAVKDLKKVRRALSEPAVPEAVRRLPDRMREAAELESNQGRPGCAWLLTYWLGELDRALAQSGEGRVPDQPDVGVIIRMVTEYNKFYRRERDAGVAMRAAIDVWRQAMLAAAPEPDGEKNDE